MSTMTPKKIQNLIAYLSILSLFSIYGCAGAVVGAGAAAGAGTYSYFTGNLTKTYESEYEFRDVYIDGGLTNWLRLIHREIGVL